MCGCINGYKWGCDLNPSPLPLQKKCQSEGGGGPALTKMRRGGWGGTLKGGPFRLGCGIKIQILIFPFFWFLLFVFLFVSLCFYFLFLTSFFLFF